MEYPKRLPKKVYRPTPHEIEVKEKRRLINFEIQKKWKKKVGVEPLSPRSAIELAHIRIQADEDKRALLAMDKVAKQYEEGKNRKSTFVLNDLIS